MIICKKLNVRVKIFALSELSVLTGIGGVTVDELCSELITERGWSGIDRPLFSDWSASVEIRSRCTR